MLWRTNADALLPILRVLCERIRSLTSLVVELSGPGRTSGESLTAPGSLGGDVSAPPGVGNGSVVMVGLTPPALKSLGGSPLSITHFPFRIGRKTDARNPLSQNDLAIDDQAPFNVSRNHCLLEWAAGRCFLVDRGSRLGTVMSGARIGGSSRTARLELPEGDGELALGGAESPYRFRITVRR